MIVAVLTLAVACGGAATTQPTFAEQQSTTDSPLITPSQAPPTQAPTPSVESPKVKLEKHSQGGRLGRQRWELRLEGGHCFSSRI